MLWLLFTGPLYAQIAASPALRTFVAAGQPQYLRWPAHVLTCIFGLRHRPATRRSRWWWHWNRVNTAPRRRRHLGNERRRAHGRQRHGGKRAQGRSRQLHARLHSGIRSQLETAGFIRIRITGRLRARSPVRARTPNVGSLSDVEEAMPAWASTSRHMRFRSASSKRQRHDRNAALMLFPAPSASSA